MSRMKIINLMKTGNKTGSAAKNNRSNRKRKRNRIILMMLVVAMLAITVGYGYSQSLPSVSVNIKSNPESKGELAYTIKIALLFTLLTLAPSIIMMMTSFTRLLISFHFLRQAMGVQGIPPNQVIIGLCLFLTIYIMMPVGMEINKVSIQPYNEGKITEMEALSKGMEPLKKFMLQQTREKDLALFYQLSKTKLPQNKNDVSMIVLIPSFVLSELKTSFQIGFLLYIPFLIIDVVVASILVALGMVFLPPVMVSLPFKIVLFIIADGWGLLITSLVKSFNMGGF